MPTYYVDPGAGGSDDGTDWTNAWTTLQRAVDGTNGTQPVAGDTVYCRGTETMTVLCDVDVIFGTTASGHIKFIGCAAGGSVDGTRYVMDANSAAVNCIYVDADLAWFENFEFKNATAAGVDGASTADFDVFINCISHSNGTHGWDLTSWDDNLFIRCKAYSNTDHGFYGTGYRCRFIFCVSALNGDCGWNALNQHVLIGCMAHDNGPDSGDWGINIDATSLAFNCIVDGERVGFQVDGDNAYILACRITNNTTGIDISDELTYCGWNLFHNNTADMINPSAMGTVHAIAIPLDGDSDTNEIDPDVDDGYNDRANDDFNLKADRTLRRTAIDLNIGT